MSFGKLPTELLDQIFAHLDNKDLSLVSLYSKHFHNAVEPSLYAHFMQTGREAIPSFLRTIAANPHLVKHVKKWTGTPVIIDLRDHAFPDASLRSKLFSDSPPSPLEQIYAKIEVWLKRDRSKRSADWRDACPDSFYYWDATTALLLGLFSSNLQSLTMESYGNARFVADNRCWGGARDVDDEDGSTQFFLQAYRWTEEALAYIRKTQIKLTADTLMPNLHHLTIHFGDPGTCLPQLSPYLRLPSIATFKGNLTGGYTVSSLSRIEDCQVDSMQNMSIYGFMLSYAGGINEFLKFFNHIQCLEYVEISMKKPNLGDGLAHLQHCLRELHLTYPRYQYDARSEFIEWCSYQEGRGYCYNHEPSIKSLAGFEKLECLTISAPTLLGYESDPGDDLWRHPHYSETQREYFTTCLPESLVHLDLDECSTAIFDCLSALFTAGPPPKLKTINLAFSAEETMEPYISQEDRSLEEWLNIEGLAAQAGVELTRNKETYARHMSVEDLLPIACHESRSQHWLGIHYNHESTILRSDMSQEYYVTRPQETFNKNLSLIA